jgi:hypothetical protein
MPVNLSTRSLWLLGIAPRRLAGLLWTTIALGLLGACAGSVPSGASCTASSDCETGLACLYALGSGCGASGYCAIPVRDCSGTRAGLVLCGCAGEALDLSCVPSSAAIAQPTATGSACPVDGGSDARDDAR